MARGQYREFINFNGKRYEVTASTPEKLKEKVEKKKADLENSESSGTMTVRRWSELLLAANKKGIVCDARYNADKRILENHILPYIGNMRLKDVKSVHIQKVISQLTEYSHGYAKQIISVLKQLFRTAYENDLIFHNPAARVKNPSRIMEVKKKRSLTDSEREIILKVCDRHWGGLYIKLMLYCGLRPGEVCALRWNNVNLSKRIITVNWALKSDGYEGSPKTENGIRKVFIAEALLKDLKKAKKGRGPFDYVCLSATGKPMRRVNSENMWTSIVKEVHKELGGKVMHREIVPPLLLSEDITLYTFRHTYCTDLQLAGIPLNVAKVLMGHGNIHMTADIYTHMSEDSVKSARLAYDSYFYADKREVK